jgi:hypothetical protein
MHDFAWSATCVRSYSPGVAQVSATIFNDVTVNIGFVFVSPAVRVVPLAGHECACEPVTATM